MLETLAKYGVFVVTVKGHGWPDNVEFNPDLPWLVFKSEYGKSSAAEVVGHYKTYGDALKEYKRCIKERDNK